MTADRRAPETRQSLDPLHSDTSQVDCRRMYALVEGLTESVTPVRRAWTLVRFAMRRRAPVMVVGIDGLPGGFAAARWAAIEAEARGVPLELVYAVDPAERTRAVVDDPGRVHRIAMAALRTAESQARSVASNLVVIRKVVHGSAASALARRNAVATCVGTNGIRTVHPGHRISTATEVMLAARGVVVVVRGDPLRRGVVLVQMDVTPALTDVLRRACVEAQVRSLGLRVLCDDETWGSRDDEGQRSLGDRLRCELDRLRLDFPGVDVETTATSSLATYFAENRSDIALFVAPRRDVHDVGTVLHPSAELAWRTLDCSVMVAAPPERRRGLRP